MPPRTARSSLVLLSLLLSAGARAEPVLDQLGARIGGYGFRESTAAAPEAGSATGWQACRMNGVGVFAMRDLTSHLFLEGALDTYFVDQSIVPEAAAGYQTPIDRVSGIATVAAGARMFPGALVSPYVQLGVGAEITRVRLPALGMEDTALLPVGFFGVGGQLRLGDRVSFGANLRINAMGYYDDDQFQTELSPSAELSAQAQFALSYRL
ncbi:MAG TPA: outer membrane beta-barrel protein [Kofleriaceae bacterium]|nr:outer membrane beta-barrel protein [Kofleriaceae bacterium]